MNAAGAENFFGKEVDVVVYFTQFSKAFTIQALILFK